MAAKKTITPASVPSKASTSSKDVTEDRTHHDPAPTSTDDDVDDLLAGVSRDRDDSLARLTQGHTAPGDDPTDGRAKEAEHSAEQSDGSESAAKRLVTDAVKDSDVARIGTQYSTGGLTGPTADGIRGALRQIDSLSETDTVTPGGGTKSTSPEGDVHIVSKDGKIKVDKTHGDATHDPETTVQDSNNNTVTVVNDRTGATRTNAKDTNRNLGTTPKLQDPPPPPPAQGPVASSERESDDDDGPGEPEDSGAPVPDVDDGDDDDAGAPSAGDDNDGQTLVDGGTDDQDDPGDGQSVELDPDGHSVEAVTGDSDGPDDPDDGQSLDPELDPNGQSLDPELDPNGQSTEPDPPPEDGQSTEPEPETGQSTEPDPLPEDDPNGQSVEEDGGEGSSSIPVSDDGSPPISLPPDISQAIQADIDKLRSLKPVTDNGFTDSRDDVGIQVDRGSAVVADVHNQILGGDDFNRDDDGPHVGGAVPSAPPIGNPDVVDFGPDNTDDVKSSGREQDPFDTGPEIKPIESQTTDDTDDTDDDDDDGATVGSPLFASSAVRSFQFDHVPAIRDDDDDDDD